MQSLLKESFKAIKQRDFGAVVFLACKERRKDRTKITEIANEVIQ
jgi:hypothetical protein